MTHVPRMNVSSRLWLAAAGILGGSGVVIAAVLAHRAGALDVAGHALARTALEMQMWHALALLGLAALGAVRGRSVSLTLSGAGFVLGTGMFCGAVYAAALGAAPGLPVAPVGGTLLILAWFALVFGALRG